MEAELEEDEELETGTIPGLQSEEVAVAEAASEGTEVSRGACEKTMENDLRYTYEPI